MAQCETKEFSAMARSTTSKRSKALNTLRRNKRVMPRMKADIIERKARLEARIMAENRPKSLMELRTRTRKTKEVKVNGKNWREFMEELVQK